MATVDFYRSVTPFVRFDEITDDRHYHEVPDDWAVLMTDVKGSTRAIEEGRYKDVNTVGAAGIVAVYNALKSLEFPFVFGGDGATILLQRDDASKVAMGLRGLARLSWENFNLELRVGIVPVSELRQAGKTIEVARYQLAGGNPVAFMRGGGVSLAESKVKEDPERYQLVAANEGEADLKGLSCRWQAVDNQRGCVLSLFVSARGKEPVKTYQSVLEGLRAILGCDLEDVNPVWPETMRYKTVRQCRREECRYHRRLFSSGWLARFAEIVAAVLVFKHGLNPLAFNPRHYRTSLRGHADYRKFDDMLRMVIDCSTENARSIRAFLEEKHGQGELDFGLHESETSLVTCFVDTVKDGGHVHFIDGGQGGYALAAKSLKARMVEDGLPAENGNPVPAGGQGAL